MKKVLITFILFLIASCVNAMDIKTFEIRETYFNTNYQKIPITGTVGSKLTSFAIKGIWGDAGNTSSGRVMLEDIYCSLDTMSCLSAITTIDFIGTPLLSPYLDVFTLHYDIIDENKSSYKLYCRQTDYTINVNIANKSATKIKIFENGDVNKYQMIFDYKEAEKFIEHLISNYPNN